jgi:hypothetical protein
MSLRIKKRWNSKFARFIRAYGVESLALRLDVRSSAIYHWIRGAHRPRPELADIIQRLARERGIRLTFDEIYGHSRDLRAQEALADESAVLPGALRPRDVALARGLH